MHVEPWLWWTTVLVTMALLLFDVFIVGRRPHTPSMKESGTYLAGYIGLAILFGLMVWWQFGAQYGGEFFAGWLTEYSLSIDNLFIFIIIMGKLAVPRQYQQTALLIGIVIALVLRGIFIAVGAAAIEQFSPGGPGRVRGRDAQAPDSSPASAALRSVMWSSLRTTRP